MFLKKQILSLNDQFKDLMSSVAKLYPDILNEDFAQKPEKSLLHIVELEPKTACNKSITSKEPESFKQIKTDSDKITDNKSPRRTDRRSRWNEWREGRAKRRSFVEGEIESKERHQQSKLNTTKRPSSLHVDDLSGNAYNNDNRRERGHRSRSEPRPESPLSPGEYTGGRLDSERRRRIRQRLVQSRKALDVVHLGLF